MTREQMKTWVNALRSGEYKQTRSQLYDPATGGYCCLGVAARVLSIVTPDNNMQGGSCGEGDSGTYEKLFRLIPDVIHEEGMSMNDSGKPFSEIADMIERDYISSEREYNA